MKVLLILFHRVSILIESKICLIIKEYNPIDFLISILKKKIIIDLIFMFIIIFIFYMLYKIQQNMFKRRTVIHIHLMYVVILSDLCFMCDDISINKRINIAAVTI